METLINLDHQIFYWINTTLSGPVFDWLFINLTDIAKTPWFYGMLFLLLGWIFRTYGVRGIALVILAVILSSLLDTASSSLLKNYFLRARPEFAHLPFEIILRRPSEGSPAFPSSHALDAFFLASFFSMFHRAWAGPLFSLAALIAISRIYVGLHFPLDVLGGGLLGSYLGIVCVATTQWLTSQRRGL